MDVNEVFKPKPKPTPREEALEEAAYLLQDEVKRLGQMVDSIIPMLFVAAALLSVLGCAILALQDARDYAVPSCLLVGALIVGLSGLHYRRSLRNDYRGFQRRHELFKRAGLRHDL